MKSQCAGRSMPAAHPGQGGKGSASVNILFDAFAFTVAAPATRPSSGPTTVHTLLAGKHTFPAMATAKVLREVQKHKEAESGGSHPAEEEQEYINFTTVGAADQPLNEKPTMATLELTPLMPQVEHDSACILPCALNMVKASSHYAFQIRIMRGADDDPLTIPCQRIICLVKSTKDSGTEPLQFVFKGPHSRIFCISGSKGRHLAPCRSFAAQA